MSGFCVIGNGRRGLSCSVSVKPCGLEMVRFEIFGLWLTEVEM